MNDDVPHPQHPAPSSLISQVDACSQAKLYKLQHYLIWAEQQGASQEDTTFDMVAKTLKGKQQMPRTRGSISRQPISIACTGHDHVWHSAK
jgi:hypothetical protein